jgi:lipopolysaccharide/colanic/teichoic acid biosynthesis glycosyltransferase
MSKVDDVVKRVVDMAVAGATLAVLEVALIGLAIKLDSKGPIFYRGVGGGLSGKSLKLFKCRSMVATRGGATSTSANGPRITRVGKVLRKYKLDEFPQFINVLTGDMSLVGPRPEVQRFVDLYTDDEKVILTVRPGITDWASIRFHNEGDIIAASGIEDADEAYAQLIRPDKLKLQLKYVRERSLATDVKILLTTFATLTKTRLPFSETEVS